MSPSTPGRNNGEVPKTPDKRIRSAFPTPPETPGRNSVNALRPKKSSSRSIGAERLLELIARNLLPDARPDAPTTSKKKSSTTLLPPVTLNEGDHDSQTKPGEVITISSDDDGAKEQLKPGDKPFRGRSTRSRVGPSAQEEENPPLRTRAFWRRQSNESQAIDDSEKPASNKADKRQSRRKVKSAQVVVSSAGEEDDTVQDEVENGKRSEPDTAREPSPVSKRMREMNEELRRKTSPIMSEDDEEELPPFVVPRGEHASTENAQNPFVLDEAEEADGEDEMSVDEDDYDDSFIDDRSDVSYENDEDQGEDLAGEPDNGQDAEGDGAPEHAEHDDGHESAPSDEDVQFELGKVQSLISQLRRHISKEDYDATIKSVTRSIKEATRSSARNAVSKSIKKGKSKARVQSPVPQDELAGITDKERDNILLAMANSMTDRRGILHDASARSSSSLVGSSSAFQTVPIPPTSMATTSSPANVPSLPTTMAISPATASVTPVTPTGAPVVPTTGNGPSVAVAATTPNGASVNNAVPLFSVTTPVTPTPTAGVTFAAFVAQTPGVASHANLYASDAVFVQHCTSLAATCDVHNPELFDPILSQDYQSLCNLSNGTIEGWSKARGRGHPWFVDWGRLCPTMHANIVLDAVRFQQSTKYINPSRAVPNIVHLKETVNKPPRYQLMRDRRVIYAFSCGKVQKCSLFTPGSNGMQQKFINVSLHKQEWERWCGWVCSVFGQDRLDAQYAMSALQMATRSDPNKRDSKDGPRALLTDAFVIDTEDDVPVFDARAAGATFNFSTDIDHVESILPRWTEGEIPVGSCVAVAYSMVTYFSGKKKWTLGCNIRWAMVLGVKDPSVDDD